MGDDLLAISVEGRLKGSAKGNCLGSNLVQKWTTLVTGEDCRVELPGQRFIVDKNHEDICRVLQGDVYLQVPDYLMPATYQLSENTHPLQFYTTSGELADLQVSGIGDFNADGYDDMLANAI